MEIKAVIFDYGRTLFDRESNGFFPEVTEVLDYLSEKYKLAIVSIATDKNPPHERMKALQEANLVDYFDPILFDSSEKEHLFEETLFKLGLEPHEVVVVDDRVVRGIKWGNENGAMTIWLRGGKFSTELPDGETGEPSQTITNLLSLKDLL